MFRGGSAGSSQEDKENTNFDSLHATSSSHVKIDQPPLDLVLHMMNAKMNFNEAKLSDTDMHENLTKKLKFLIFLWDVVRLFEGKI